MQVLWVVVSTFLFATMGVCIKYASESFNTAEIVFYRGLVGMAILWAMSRSQGVSLKTPHPFMHAWRSLTGVTSMGCWFYALTQIPLASAMTLNYMSSLWIAVILLLGAAWTLRPGYQGQRQALNIPLVITISIGFAGVVLMLQPSFAQDQTVPALIGLCSGLLSALAYMQLSAMARIGEPESRTVFYFGLGSTLMGLGGMVFMGMSPWPGWQQALWLLPLSLLAAGGQITLTKAYSSAKTQRSTLVAANLQYSGIVFASLYSLFLFGDALGLAGWTGMALIVICGMAASIFRARGAAQPVPTSKT
ncbi:DMT family transporter [Comamonas sp. GB3 AK4-5]|uniref:DMT family transporter n=1 Tax=Comamonas sp. GB3 AK4-5 TaxID=3231487 RepID=UPI00351E3118